MLRIAVPNKGSLSETAVEMLREAGYATRLVDVGDVLIVIATAARPI